MIENFILRCQQRINRLLIQNLSYMTEVPGRLQQAMSYVVLNGGKRIRPALIYATAEALGIGWHKLDSVACAIEFIHAYSLVHDDLPAMDDDEFRRGQLTCHKAFDEATAILVGDALQSLAFEVISRDELLPAEQRIHLIQILAKAAGAAGMVGGQAMDLAATNQRLTLPELCTIHEYKTGALLKACVEFPLVLCHDKSPVEMALLSYAQAIGLAFQIKDDLLDYAQAIEKQDNQEPSFALLVNYSQTEQKLHELYQQALKALQFFGQEADYLRELAGFIIKRTQ
ncbi:MAG: geranyl transferase [Gammaproteobacteria bacterium]|jgi:farnesyl diphosphate synthase|nr:geranyl transferase [Gammaproteobacteria bacterium]